MILLSLIFLLTPIYFTALCDFSDVPAPTAYKTLVQFRGKITESSVFLFTENDFQQFEGEYLEIEMLPRLFTTRYGDIPKRIYIRHCYRKLYEIVTKHMINYHDKFPVTLFTGVPGIGKSLFLVYFLFTLFHDNRFPDKRFALEFASGVYHYFVPTTEYGVFELSESITLSVSQLLEIPIFADISKKDQPQGRGKWLFIFSSPDPQRYQEIMKNRPKFRYTLPTWSYLELLFLQSDDTKWIELFILFAH